MMQYLIFAAALAALVVSTALLLRDSARARREREEKAALRESLLSLSAALAELRQRQAENASAEEARFERLRQSVEQSERSMRGSVDVQLEKMRSVMEEKLTGIQRDNQDKLESIRLTVDEKLSSTLNKRLGESFTLVNERLEAVYKGLGEMQSLATGVGDLKNVLTNVKTRGTWGEVQLDTLLAQIMAPTQYIKSAQVAPGSRERVDFAIVMPGKDDRKVYLPIDAKFPMEDYQRLLSASEAGDKAALEDAAAKLETAVRLQAKSINAKYILPPNTTDFACMFLPTEGLYAEVLRRPGLCEALQRDYRVVVTGPTTVSALLNSLQIGFKTIAIEQRSSQVWSLLGAVKSEFGKFADILAKTQKNLQQAANTIDDAARKTRTIERRLRGVEELEADKARDILALDEDGSADI